MLFRSRRLAHAALVGQADLFEPAFFPSKVLAAAVGSALALQLAVGGERPYSKLLSDSFIFLISCLARHSLACTPDGNSNALPKASTKTIFMAHSIRKNNMPASTRRNQSKNDHCEAGSWHVFRSCLFFLLFRHQ